MNEADIPSVSKYASKIITWYNQFKNAETFKEDGFRLKKIRHVHDNEFEIEYVGDEFTMESFLDIDDDGNYPLTIGDNTYLVSGELME